MSDPRAVAIVGAGIGAEHFRAYRRLPERFAVRTICELDPDRAAPLVAEDPGLAVETDLARVLADPAIDIVDICLPPHLHLDACLRALAAGKHVICEKPLVTALRDADRLAQAEASGRARIFPVFQYRFGRGAAQLRALIDAGITGTPFVATLETHWDRGAEYYAAPWRGTWAGERGGAVLGHAIHIHDWLSFVLGPVASVHAELATRVNPIEVEDCAALAIRMHSGALATSSITLGAAGDTSRMRFCFAGLTAESGTAPYAPAEDAWRFTARDPADQPRIDAVVAAVPETLGGFAGLFNAVADALDGQPSEPVALADARRSLDFVTAVYASARTGAPVGLPIGRDHALYDGWAPDPKASVE
ncbi:MAG: Gfo/Idh/MocA family oxidoreductase [Rhodobacter sp.]|nr:Gfo/Idh/MocA family oxidoreductase [Rhodobacter sp.]